MAVQFNTLMMRSPALAAAKRPARVPGTAAAALGEVLLERRVITPDQLRIAIEHQRTTNRRIGQLLIDLGFTNADAVLGGLSLQLGVASTRLNNYRVSVDAVQALPEKLARKHHAVPLQKIGQILQVAIAVPTDLIALDELRFASGCQIQTLVALEDEIADAIDRFYASGLHEGAAGDDPAAPETAVTIERRDASRADRRGPGAQGGRRKTDVVADETFAPGAEETAVATVDRLLATAAAVGASDIHLERTRDCMRVRFRVDGTFQEMSTVPLVIAPAICARLKVLAGMDIAEHRLPQDGRLTV